VCLYFNIQGAASQLPDMHAGKHSYQEVSLPHPVLYNIINKIINNCIVLTARTPALSFFQNPALDRESNPHLIF
jgi:hypothetical protein